MYAIIKDGSHQYRVAQGDKIRIERTGLKAGDTVTFGDVLFVAGKVGTPTVKGAQVTAIVESDVKGPKIYVQKYKRRKNYRRRFGHRQKFTQVRIDSIQG